MYETLLTFLIVIFWANLLERTRIKWYGAALGCIVTPVLIYLLTLGVATLAEIPMTFSGGRLTLALIQLPFALILFYLLDQLRDAIVWWAISIILGAAGLFYILPWLLSRLGVVV